MSRPLVFSRGGHIKTLSCSGGQSSPKVLSPEPVHKRSSVEACSRQQQQFSEQCPGSTSALGAQCLKKHFRLPGYHRPPANQRTPKEACQSRHRDGVVVVKEVLYGGEEADAQVDTCKYTYVRIRLLGIVSYSNTLTNMRSTRQVMHAGMIWGAAVKRIDPI